MEEAGSGRASGVRTGGRGPGAMAKRAGFRLLNFPDVCPAPATAFPTTAIS